MFNNFLFFSGFPATTGHGAAPPHRGREGGVEGAVLHDRQGLNFLDKIFVNISIDKDESGFIELGELKEALDLAGFKVPGWRVRDMIDK